MNGENTTENKSTGGGRPVTATFEVFVPPIAKIALALSKAQGAFEEIKKTQAVKGKAYTFYYADLAGILAATKKALSENQIAVIQLPEIKEGSFFVKTRLIHSSGEELVGEMSVPVPSEGSLQDLGKTMTYLRRYSLQAMLSVAADDDTDGDMESAEVSDNKPQVMANDKMGEQVKGILIALDNADFFKTLSKEWKESFSHMFSTKESNALESDKWKDITEIGEHVDLVALAHRKNIAKAANYLEEKMAKFKKGGK